METINFFERVLTIITVGVLVLVFVLLNEIGAEHVYADYTHTNFSAPCDAIIKGNENIDLQPIKLRGAGTYNLKLENVYLDLSNTKECAFYIENGTNVNLILVGDNVIISGGGKAGISVECDSTLKIGGDGSLLVRGGNSDEMGVLGLEVASDLEMAAWR